MRPGGRPAAVAAGLGAGRPPRQDPGRPAPSPGGDARVSRRRPLSPPPGTCFRPQRIPGPARGRRSVLPGAAGGQPSALAAGPSPPGSGRCQILIARMRPTGMPGRRPTRRASHWHTVFQRSAPLASGRTRLPARQRKTGSSRKSDRQGRLGGPPGDAGLCDAFKMPVIHTLRRIRLAKAPFHGRDGGLFPDT